jgi:glycogen phosphorylase
MILADYRSYIDCHDRTGAAWADQERWTRMSILNTARSGFFSSDRTVRDYCRDIWHAEPVAMTPGTAPDPRIPLRLPEP